MELTKSDRETLVNAVVAVMIDDLGYESNSADDTAISEAGVIKDRLGIDDISDVFATDKDKYDRREIVKKYLRMAVNEIIMPHTEKEVTDGVTA